MQEDHSAATCSAIKPYSEMHSKSVLLPYAEYSKGEIVARARLQRLERWRSLVIQNTAPYIRILCVCLEVILAKYARWAAEQDRIKRGVDHDQVHCGPSRKLVYCRLSFFFGRNGYSLFFFRDDLAENQQMGKSILKVINADIVGSDSSRRTSKDCAGWWQGTTIVAQRYSRCRRSAVAGIPKSGSRTEQGPFMTLMPSRNPSIQGWIIIAYPLWHISNMPKKV